MESPFFIFENTKNGEAICFADPVVRLQARALAEVKPCLEYVERWQRKGFYVAGYVAYEAGWAFQNMAPAGLKTADEPLLDFYVFKNRSPFLHPQQEPPATVLYDFSSTESLGSYTEKIAKIHSYLTAGDSYQVNLTQRTFFESANPPLETYQNLRKVQAVEYASFLSYPEYQILSFSPELFIKRQGQRLTTKPMKGTAARHGDAATDMANKTFLMNDEKNRAENLMIVDLLRNDMGRIAKPGSVKVPSLFAIEDYATVYQMVSEVECELPPTTGFVSIFESLFPCGSITGAPKRRTMEIIDELETDPRGVYTGAIGFVEPSGDFSFNVAIRTAIKWGRKPYRLGTGGGILLDSQAKDEFREAQLKSRFARNLNQSFEILETMKFDGERLVHFDEHVERLEASARFFGFEFDRDKVCAEVQRKILGLKRPTRLRWRLKVDGSSHLTLQPMLPLPEAPVVGLSSTPVNSQNLFQYHKTTVREIYDREYLEAMAAGYYDLIYLNERQELVEASRHNIFIKKGIHWLTPPLNSGALAGIERAVAIRELNAQETILKRSDLYAADEICLTNSVRGRVVVTLKDL